MSVELHANGKECIASSNLVISNHEILLNRTLNKCQMQR